jgi:hypothetical protein
MSTAWEAGVDDASVVGLLTAGKPIRWHWIASLP